MKNVKLGLLLLVAGAMANGAMAQRQMETLGRGVVAIRQSSTQVYVGWRLLGTDPDDTKFNLYRVTGSVTNLLVANVTNSCNFVDSGANTNSAHSWFVQPILNGVTQAISAAFSMPASAPTQAYLNIPLTPPPDGVAYDGVPYTYNANDCSVGDVDGDGEYEIILKWDPSNSHDNSQSGFTGNTFLDCYKLNGTRLWRFDLGPNIRSGAHYMDFMVYDFDGDGKAELMCRTAPGAKDALGNYIGGAAKWQNANGARPAFNDTDDYRFNNPNANTTNGYVIHGPEFLSVFNGLTGEEMATATYYPKRDQDNNNDNPDTNRLDAVWGDHYGNRLDRFLAGVAYCDGLRPSAIFCRGYYTRAYLVAWDWRNGQLTRRWIFDSNDGTPGNTAYRGQGAHSLTIGDVDGDGKDEITYGACVIDDNGKGLYSTGLGHGDALHMSDMDPNRPGLEVWMVHEDPGSYGPTGLEFRDAKNGSLIFGLDGQNADVGRGVAIDIDPRYPGYEMWGARGGLMNAGGTQVWTSRPSSMNFACWWDADLLREILDGTTISKWDWLGNTANNLLSPGGIASNNSTKSTPNLSGDILGDWREEVIWRTSDNLNLRIYTTTTPATNRFYTLMHDPQYRVAIAWQNTGYNQPPHPGFYIGPGMYPPPLAPDSDAQLAWRGGGNNAWDVATTSNWSINGLWTNTVITNFNPDNSVLFDLRASNNTSINLTTALSPSRVTVYSPSNFTFTGSGALTGTTKLFKAGPGKLTLNNTNAFTGSTLVSGGQLIVNGSLVASPIIIEARGEAQGRARIGGGGQLGAGLIVQAGCGVIVGPGTNAPGTLTVTNTMTELGNVLNQFDLSNDPTGTTNANDVVNIYGNLALSGTNTIAITQLNGALAGGVYPLFKYTGTLTGGLTNLLLSGAFIQPVSLTNPPGMIGLVAVIPAAPPVAPSALIATAVGAFQINLAWTDNSSDENAFFIERSTSNTANFAQIALNAPNDTSYQDTTVAANTTYYYRVRGTNLAGASAYSNTNSATTTPPPTSLTWHGDGTGNLWDAGGALNWSDGANLVVYSDGTTITFDQSGSNNTPTTLSGTLQPNSVTVNAAKNYTLTGNGILAGSMAMTKSNSGTFTINTTNTFSGGINLNAGTVSLGNAGAGGVGALRFNGGSLTFSGSGQPTYANPLVINSNSTLTSSGGNNNIVSGTWSGANTLNIAIASGTFTLGGNLTGFSGTVALGNSAGFLRFYGSTGNASTTFDLGTGTATLNNRNGVTITLGALTGGSGTFVSGAGANDAPSTYIIGGKNLSTTFAGTIQNASSLRTTAITKVGNGSLTLTGNNPYSGATTVSAGKLIVNGNQSAATGNVTVSSGATLGGTGIIGGSTTVNGTLAPGNSIGTLTFSLNLTLASGSSSLFEISKNPFGNDSAVVASTVTYGGTLNVINTSVELLAAGDNFQLFSGASYVNSFAAMNLPVLDDDLAWSTSHLATDGRLWVVSTIPPVINHVGNSGNNLTLDGAGGTPNWTYFVLTATNAALPVGQWTRVATNQFDAGGSFNFSAPLDPVAPQRFYRLQAQ